MMEKRNADEQAERAAREILGEYVPLCSVWTGEYYLFTCLNGYAAVDADGRIIEAWVSLL